MPRSVLHYFVDKGQYFDLESCLYPILTVTSVRNTVETGDMYGSIFFSLKIAFLALILNYSKGF